MKSAIALLLVGFSLVACVPPKRETQQERYEKVIQKVKAATSDNERFYSLNHAAKESYNVGRFDDARKYALELRDLTPRFTDDWNYGNAIQDFNLVLGRLALRDGHTDEAKDYLLAAGHSSGSPQMDSFGPNMSLAKDLLEKGEKDVVLQYFELCRSFWSSPFGKIDEWKNDVQSGKMPDFGANLFY